MKKVALFLSAMVMLLCSGCGGSVPVDGTWYSVVDAGMYNFKDGSITLSGVTVGQYEDNGDSVVVSMMSDGTNIQLYVTTMDDVDVLADVKNGDGNIYFCKGFENANMIIENAEKAAEEKKAAEEQEFINKYKDYWDKNSTGVWETSDPKAYLKTIEFSDDEVGLSYVDGEKETLYWLGTEFYMGEYYPQLFIKISDDKNATDEEASYINIKFVGDSISKNSFKILDAFYDKK